MIHEAWIVQAESDLGAARLLSENGHLGSRNHGDAEPLAWVPHQRRAEVKFSAFGRDEDGRVDQESQGDCPEMGG
jgi:hypothetical protein